MVARGVAVDNRVTRASLLLRRAPLLMRAFDGPHDEVVTIVPEANDAPTIEHRVTVR